MKIHIVFNIQDKPTGGGNQFLKALKKYFNGKEIYTDSPEEADVFLFNSYQFVPEIIQLKNIFPQKIFIHRIDGPIRLYSRMSDKRDNIINLTNKYIADATIFQSEWSKNKNFDLGLKKSAFKTVITNAPDKNIFNTKGKSKFRNSGKIRLIATSWSSWHKKGFDVYKWLDENLNFDKYEMTFCGNSVIEFNNIKHIKPVPSNLLAEQLKKHDIFITASQQDPCSNSLIEALHCGLPAIALNAGGHPEIIKNAGEIFDKKEQIPELLKQISINYAKYVKNINMIDIDKISEKYINFIQYVLDEKTSNKLINKDLSIAKAMCIRFLLLQLKIKAELKKYL